jgi:death-on-curing protein
VKEAVFLTLEECLRLHEEQIRRFGGSAGLRDPGLLESALARPRSGYYQTLSEQAAALLQSLVTNPCFVSGNKRMAFAASAIFLHMNGFHLDANAGAGKAFMVERVIRAKAELAEIAGWISSRLSPLSPDIQTVYAEVSKRHRKSLDKLGRSEGVAKPVRRKSR